VTRTRRQGLARNAALALGNRSHPDDLDVLRDAAAGDPDPVVRESAAWALERRQAAPVSGRG
jgi:epoxyqueuosine reductase